MITTVAMGAGGNAVVMIMGVWSLGHGAPNPKPPGPPTASLRPHFLWFPYVQTGQSTHRTVSKQ